MGDIKTSVPTNRNLSLNTNIKLPGPFQSYSYPAFINSPAEMGMKGGTSGWGLDTISSNFGGLMSYIQMLVTGNSVASKAASLNFPLNGKSSGAPLGNAYVFNTGLQCKSNVDGNLKDAVAYINNVPLGNIPIISSVAGGDFQELRGLLPGIFENINGFNPMIIVEALDISNGELCQNEVETDPAYSLPLTNITPDGKSYEDGKSPVEFSRLYMFPSMVRNIDPCLFRGNGATSSSKKNPETGTKCVEKFSNINDNNNYSINNIQTQIDNHLEKLNVLNKDDWIVQLYYISVSLLIIFIVIKLLNKNK